MASEAVAFFWATRIGQQKKQTDMGLTDAGARGAVTGGKQMDGFLDMLRYTLESVGVPSKDIFTSKNVELPGYYRPTKQWDLVVVRSLESGEKRLLAAIELKSHVGSISNNFNNRTEEAMGSSLDIWTAYRERAFGNSKQPWLGYLMLLEKTELSTQPVKVKEPHFSVFEEFKNTSYAERYEVFCRRLVLERKYTAAALLLSSQKKGIDGKYKEPADDLTVYRMITSMLGHILGELASE